MMLPFYIPENLYVIYCERLLVLHQGHFYKYIILLNCRGLDEIFLFGENTWHMQEDFCAILLRLSGDRKHLELIEDRYPNN